MVTTIVANPKSKQPFKRALLVFRAQLQNLRAKLHVTPRVVVSAYPPASA